MIQTMITRFIASIAIIFIATPALAQVSDRLIDQESQYWQRINAASAAYTYGVKAQQLLNHNIAFCTAELKTLQDLNHVHRALSKNPKGGFQDVKESEYYGWKTQTPIGVDLNVTGEYHDFEGCMRSHGWERVKYVPYDVASEARETYKATHYKTAIERAKMQKRQKELSKKRKRSQYSGGGIDRDHVPNETYNN